MNKELKHSGFSLTEVLLAVGTLSIGMIFVAGVFPVAIHFSTIASERTIAAVVADEAFAKIRLYGEAYSQLYPDWVETVPDDGCVDFNDLVPIIGRNEFAYPSYLNADILRSRYCWSALCWRVSPDPTSRLVQVTVFVCRRTGAAQSYWNWDPVAGVTDDADHPVPVRVDVSQPGPDNELLIDDVDERKKVFINDGYAIVDDENGQIYRVRERYPSPKDDTIVLDRPWNPGLVSPDRVWVVPPPADGGRYPCIAVYQKVIRF